MWLMFSTSRKEGVIKPDLAELLHDISPVTSLPVIVLRVFSARPSLASTIAYSLCIHWVYIVLMDDHNDHAMIYDRSPYLLCRYFFKSVLLRTLSCLDQCRYSHALPDR